MLARLGIGERAFAPSWPLTLLAGAAVVAFIALGRWQWDRGIERRAQWTGFEAGSPALAADSRDLGALPRFRRVALTGRYVVDRQFVLDNRTRDGRAGFEVLTPFLLGDGRVVLVNRGWMPFSGYRDRIPDVDFAAGARETIVGRLDRLPSAGLARGRAAPSSSGEWPKLVSFPTMQQLSAVYEQDLEQQIVLLDREFPHGLQRDWRPPGTPPARHFSYAVQWWAFAALTAILWIVSSFRRKLE